MTNSIPQVDQPVALLRKGARIGIFIVAYNASTTIVNVLQRIKDSTWSEIDEVFVFDDSSSDATSSTARNYDGVGTEKLKVFYNKVNLGYGGNQKRGYLYAIKNNFDVVVLLHADGQYAPEYIDDLIGPIAKGEAHAVFGSRMLEKGAARRGGMPLYKYFGNKILSGFQNIVLNTKYSEFHSGYRAYHVPMLSKLPFTKNTNDFHFDTEIILQLLDGGYKIKEVPIPTYYGNEICGVNGVVYALNVFIATLSYKLQRSGLYYSEQYDVRGGSRYAYKANRFSSHERIVAAVERRSSEPYSVLDIGCGSGALAARLAMAGNRVVGVDVHDSEEASENCSRFIACDVERSFGLSENEMFDIIIFADILEHVRNPEQLIMRARRHLKPQGVIIASTGNVAHIWIRLMLLFGQFTYAERGILDRTHVRLFTRRTFRKLFRECALRKLDERYCAIPFENIFPDWHVVSNAASYVNMFFAWLWPTMFAYQFVLTLSVDDSAPSELLRLEQINAAYD